MQTGLPSDKLCREANQSATRCKGGSVSRGVPSKYLNRQLRPICQPQDASAGHLRVKLGKTAPRATNGYQAAWVISIKYGHGRNTLQPALISP